MYPLTAIGDLLAIQPSLASKLNNVGVSPLSEIGDACLREQIEGRLFQGQKMDPMYLSTVPSSSELIISAEKPLDPRNPMYLPINDTGQELKTNSSSAVKPVNPFTAPAKRRFSLVSDGLGSSVRSWLVCDVGCVSEAWKRAHASSSVIYVH